MPLNAPLFTWCPSYEPELEEPPQLLVAKFGDGYSQAAPDGLNHIKRRWTLSWNNEDMATAKAIRDFLRERGGWQPFYWIEPTGVEAALFTCPAGLRRRQSGPQLFTLSATFEEDFNLPNEAQEILDVLGPYPEMVETSDDLDWFINTFIPSFAEDVP